MNTILTHTWRLALAGAILGAASSPLAASAQSQLDTSEAQAFVGEWDLNVQTDMGPLAFDLEIADQGGKVGASMGSPDLGGMQEVTDITRSGDDLVLRYQMDAQGQLVPVAVTLTPNAEGLDVSLDFADGMYTASGTGTKAEG
jgi:hypothetical protein